MGSGESGADTVFTRTFSMLIVASVLNAHRRHPSLPDSELQVIKSKILRYLKGEKDLRGYVPGGCPGRTGALRQFQSGRFIGIVSSDAPSD
ncbi:MAG: DUF2785 domain-containing protein [Chloroflexi bacterium]|nr:DUF2785 domain-containing protein [Chloroflexota bacterium]